METKEPKVIILDVGKKLVEFRKRYAETAPYLHDTSISICTQLVACATNRVAPYGELLNLVGKIKHSQSSVAPVVKINSFAMAVGDLGFEMIDSMRRLGFRGVNLEEDENMPYHFVRASRNIVVLKHNKAA